MKTRIQEILNYYQLSAAEFAKIIGVSPSGLSHILNGNRNYLSTDTIVKLTQKFPEIQLDWLILGKGQMISGKSTAGLFDKLISTSDSDQTVIKPDSKAEDKFENIRRRGTKVRAEQNSEPSAITSTEFPPVERRITKVVVFYSDSTFVDLYP